MQLSMPQIPAGTHRPTLEQTVIDLLESIALEEIAISHILNAQGEKAQAIIKQYECNALEYSDLLCGFRDSKEMINSVIMKEWLLYNKLHTVLSISPAQPTVAVASPSPAKPISQCKGFVEKYGCHLSGSPSKTLCERCIHHGTCG